MANYLLHYVGRIPRGTVSADYFGVSDDRIRELVGAENEDLYLLESSLMEPVVTYVTLASAKSASHDSL